jgi:hypothetical protein
MPETPGKARFLSQEEKEAVVRLLQEDCKSILPLWLYML